MVEEVREANRARLLASLRGYWRFYIKYPIIYLILNISSIQNTLESQLIFFFQHMATAQYFNYFATRIPIGRLAATSCPKYGKVYQQFPEGILVSRFRVGSPTRPDVV